MGEFTYKPTDSVPKYTFKTWFIVKDSIRMREGGTYREVILPASKTDPFQKGITLTISASEDDTCPVKAMRQFLAVDTHRAAHSPLFCIGQLEQQAFTRE